MATKEKALQYAQDWANREGKEYVIQQQGNGQWLVASASCPTRIHNTKPFQVVHPNNKEK
jgi:hypothetical protein